MTQFPVGAIASPIDKRDILYKTIAPPAVALPRKFSLRDKMSPVVMQNYGSCVGHAGRSLKEYQEMKERGSLVLLSARWAYANAKTFDGMPYQEGTTPRALLKGLAGDGICLEEQFPNNPCPPTHDDYIKLPNDDAISQTAMQYGISGFVRFETLEEIKQSIFAGNPVLISVNVYDTFDGIQPDGWIGKKISQSYNRGGHEILAMGWDDDMHTIGGLEIKNQWGETWGNNGYGFMAYDYEGPYQLFIEAWTATDQVDAGATIGAPMNLAYPVDTPFITQHFGANPQNYAKFGLAGHEGTDYRAVVGTKIYAVDDGKVLFAGWKNDYGNCVIIEHAWGMTIYAHLSQLRVGDSDPNGLPPSVAKRALLGLSGATGNVTAPHLHFGGKINGVKNDPFKGWVNLESYIGKTETMDLINDNGTFYLKGNKGKIGIADMGFLTMLRAATSEEHTGSTVGSPQVKVVQTLPSVPNAFVIKDK